MHCLVLIAGMPASGKTTFAAHLAAELQLPMVSKDRIKELLYNGVGFANAEEKASIGRTGMELLYYFAETIMRTGQSVVLENNFEDLAKPQLHSLTAQYAYRALTVRFGADAEVLYRRYLERDTGPGRHRGHVVQSRYPDDSGAPLVGAPLSFEAFVGGAQRRGIRDFAFGEAEMYVDTTHFEQVQYHDLVDKIRRFMGGAPQW